MRIKVPTIHDDVEHFERLFEIIEATLTATDVFFDFTECEYLRQNAVATLGGLARLIESRGGTVVFEWGGCCATVLKNLKQNGFIRAFGKEVVVGIGNSIPYKESPSKDKVSLMQYIKKDWLERGWLNITADERSAVAGNAWEVYENAFEHSGSAVGVFSCGQFYPKTKELTLCVVDFGVGIPHNVRNFLGQLVELGFSVGSLSEEDHQEYKEVISNFASEDALEWAFLEGKSTRKSSPGGLGLKELARFVSGRNGRLEVYSEYGRAVITNQQRSFSRLKKFFPEQLFTSHFSATRTDSMKTLKIFDLIGEDCVSGDDGRLLYSQMEPVLATGEQVELDFFGVDTVASPFFNAGIGRWLEKMDLKELEKKVHFSHLPSSAPCLLKRVFENAESFYSDPNYSRAVEDVMAKLISE